MEGVRETIWIQQSDEKSWRYCLEHVVSVNLCFHERAFAMNTDLITSKHSFFFSSLKQQPVAGGSLAHVLG